jgi:hypothetical protein
MLIKQLDLTDGLKIVTDIEGGNVDNVKRISENHFSLQMKPDIPSVYKYPDHHSYWCYFKIEGTKGREIQIDITNCDWMPGHWKKYKPVYSYTDDPDNLTGVEWHRVEKTKLKRNMFSFSQIFENEHAWVALRYPYNYTRLKRYIESVRGNEHVDIEELGNTAMGDTLFMIIITDKNIPVNKKKGMLVFSREHGVEQDGSWVAEGMIDLLISTKPVGDSLRRNFISMIVPIISPDAAITGRVVDPETGNSPGIEFINNRMNSIEARFLYNRINKFLQDGSSLDISISLHNPHGTEPNIYPHYRPYKNTALLEKAKRLHRAIIKNSAGYTKWKEFTMESCLYSVGSFAKDFGSIVILYEVNHQANNNYLSLEKLRGLGGLFLKGIADYYGLLQ